MVMIRCATSKRLEFYSSSHLYVRNSAVAGAVKARMLITLNPIRPNDNSDIARSLLTRNQFILLIAICVGTSRLYPIFLPEIVHDTVEALIYAVSSLIPHSVDKHTSCNLLVMAGSFFALPSN